MADQMLEVGASVNFAPITTGFAQAVSVTTESTAQMSSSFGTVAKAGTEFATVLTKVQAAQREAAEAARIATIAQRRQYEEFMKMNETGSHAAVSGVQATSAAIRSMEGNAGLRAVENFISKTLGLGPAMQAIFPIIGALAFGSILLGIGEKAWELRTAALGAGAALREAFTDLHEKAAVSNDELRITSDRLALAIAKLQGMPSNGLFLALDESRKMADQLAVSLRNDRKELEALLKEHDVGVMGEALSGVAATGKQHKEMLADQKALTDQVKAANIAFQNATANTEDAEVVKRAGETRDKAIQAAYQTQIDSYKRESQRLATEQQNADMLVMSGVRGAQSIDNSAKVAAIEGRTQQLVDALANENLQVKIAGQTAQKEQLTQDKELAEQKKQAARAAAEAAKQAAAEQRRAEEEQLRGWQEALVERKISEGAFHQDSKKEDADYWAAILANQRLSATQRRAIEREYLVAKNGADREALADFIAGKKDEAAESDKTSEQAIVDYMAIADAMEKAYGKGSKQAIDAQRELARVTREVYAAQDEAARKADEAAAKARKPSETAQTGRIAVASSQNSEVDKTAQAELQAGMITRAQYETMIQQSEERVYGIKLDALQKRRALEALDPNGAEETQRTDNEIEKLTQDHEARLTEISNTALFARAKAISQFSSQLAGDANSAFASWERGHGSFAQSFEKSLGNMVISLQGHLLQMGAQWAAHYAQQTLLHELTNATKTASDVTTAATAKGISLSQAFSQANHSAMTAATNTFASVSAIPVVGPALAPIAAAGAYTAVLGLTALASASGGWDAVPADNTLANLHKDEMVLPATLSDRIRKMTGGGNSITNHFGGNTINGGGKSFPELLDDHEDALAYKVQSLQRDGKLG